VFEKFRSILVAGGGGRRRHLRLAELCVIESSKQKANPACGPFSVRVPP
jgi:hypothetical protein